MMIWMMRGAGLLFLGLAGFHLTWGGTNQLLSFGLVSALCAAFSEVLAAGLRWRGSQLRQADLEYVASVQKAIDG